MARVTFRTVNTFSVIHRSLSCYVFFFNDAHCLLYRDALAKEIYSRLFGWLISQVNDIVYSGKRQLSIAVLDIFGFEVSKQMRRFFHLSQSCYVSYSTECVFVKKVVISSCYSD